MSLPRWIGPGAVAFLGLWAALLAAGRSSFLRDPGTFWHTTTGERILTEGFIRTDPYTFTFAGTWWVPYQWLGEVGMALAHRAGGFDTQLLGAVTIIAAVFAALAVRLLRTGLHPVAAGAILLLGLAAASSHFHVRPHLFTLACLTLTVGWLADCDTGRCSLGKLGLLIPLFVVWTNVHGGMLGGLATLGLVFAGWVGFWLLGRPSPVAGWRDVIFLAMIGLACGLSALCSPYGLDLVKTWHVILGEPALKQIIQEHRPLDLNEPYSWPVVGLAAAFLFVLAGVPWREVRVTWLVPFFWLFQVFDRVRHAPLFAVVTLVAIAAMWSFTRWARWLATNRPDFYQPPGEEPHRPWWANVWLPVLVVLTSFSLHVAHVSVPVIGSGWAKHDPGHWPVDLLDVLKEHEPRSSGQGNRLFNGYIDGGFVIYHAPGYKVFVDDRCEVFGGEWLLEFVTAASGDTAAAVAKWEERYGAFDFALVRRDSRFEDVFAGSPEWELVKRTETATFYRRR